MTTMTTTRDFIAIAKFLANGEPFRTHGAMRSQSGNPERVGYSTGRLPGDWSRTLQARQSLTDYVIYSYATPIAWLDREAGWVIPAESYSVTTTRHQGRIRAALTFNGETYAE